MAGVTTHVLDNLAGRPAVGMRIDFSVNEGGRWKLLKTMHTNVDGRTDQPMMSPAEARVGEYELTFHIGDYYSSQAGKLPPDAQFVDPLTPVRFSIFDTGQHYHVPMLCTPWSCATYR